MLSGWDSYSRLGLDVAAAATSLGFSVVKTGTKIGFAITKGIASTTAGATGVVVDHAVFGGSQVTRPILGGAVSSALTFAEQLTFAPIFLGEYITSTSLLAAHSSINVLNAIFPGSSEASFSLASFITLVRREWTDPIAGNHLPDHRFRITEVARAVVSWAALQGVTQEWQEKRWLKSMREMHVESHTQRPSSVKLQHQNRIRVTSDVVFPGHSGQLISADFGKAPPARAQSLFYNAGRPGDNSQIAPETGPSTEMPNSPLLKMSNRELKTNLRRLSKIVLAGYGGASLLFFGISPLASSGKEAKGSVKALEQAQLASAIDVSEAEAAGDPLPSDSAENEHSWWDILLGRHDREIFERFANTPVGQTRAEIAKAEINAECIRATAVIGSEHLMPRFWVLSDHSQAQIVLVLRGTMSLNEIAADLTCDPEEFEPSSDDPDSEGEYEIPGRLRFPRRKSRSTDQAFSTAAPLYHVHGGMLRMARAMGAVGKPVQLAVQAALHRNPDYELILCGHSLGAGVAALLGLIWADPNHCRTVRSSGLPIGRCVSVYCFAPPCIADANLAKLASKLVVSFVYSHDIVSRLSLGSVRDLKNSAMWLCDANKSISGKCGEGYTTVTTRARNWKAGKGVEDDPDWFVAVRKTLEANMQMADLFPPGRVLWAIRDCDLHPSHRLVAENSHDNQKLRLFEVLNSRDVFSQIVFARDMLSAHMPHRYDQALDDLL